MLNCVKRDNVVLRDIHNKIKYVYELKKKEERFNRLLIWLSSHHIRFLPIRKRNLSSNITDFQ